jgi:hypothetical protein
MPAGIGLETGPFFLPICHAVEYQNIGQAIAHANFVGPEPQHANAMLAKKLHGVFGKAVVEGWQSPRNGQVHT